MIDVTALLQATDTVALIGETVRLKKQGAQHYGLCPLHNDKTPTLRVDPKKGLWYCPSCQVGGNAIDWLTKAEGLTFREAAAELAKIAGIDASAPRAERPIAEPKDPRYPHQRPGNVAWGGQHRMTDMPSVLILHEFPGRQNFFRFRSVFRDHDVIWWPTLWDPRAGYKGSGTPSAQQMQLQPIAKLGITMPPPRDRYEARRAAVLERLIVRWRGYAIMGETRRHQAAETRQSDVAA